MFSKLEPKNEIENRQEDKQLSFKIQIKFIWDHKQNISNKKKNLKLGSSFQSCISDKFKIKWNFKILTLNFFLILSNF